MKTILLGAAILVCGGCQSGEGNWRHVETSIEEWQVPPPATAHMVSNAMPYDQIIAYIDKQNGSGWEVVEIDPAGDEFPGCYIVSFRKKS